MKFLTLFSIVFTLLFVSCDDHHHAEGHDHDHAAEAVSNDAVQAALDNFVKVWNTGDKDLLKATISDDFVRVQNSETVASGFEEMSANVDFFRDGFPDLHVNIDEVHIHEGKCYSKWTCSGINTGEFNGQPATGKAMMVSGLSVGTVNEAGQLTGEIVHFDMLLFLSQLGYTISPPVAASTE